MRKILLLSLFVFLNAYGFAQDPYDYYYNNLSRNENAADITPDTELFLIRIGGGGSLFNSFSDFNFSAVKYSRRGYPADHTRNFWGNIDLSGLVSHIPDYATLTNLRRANSEKMSDHYSRLSGEVNEYLADVRSLVAEGYSVSAFAYNHKGRLGVKASAAGTIDGKSNYGLWGSRRWGRDPAVGGVFTDETAFAGGADRRLAANHCLSLMMSATASENGLRTYAVREAFELTGNNLYNPSWGYYGGKVKNSKTADRFQPLLVLNYSGRLGETTTLTAAAAYRFGTEKRGGLAWFDAETPYPDYYRYLPGYEASNSAAAWRANDPRVMQIYWEQLVEQNVNGGAAYVFENRVERFGDMQFGVSARTVFGTRISLLYGFRLRRDNRRNYKEIHDMLGASPMIDADQYLIDDDVYDDRSRNDLRNPDRLVGSGDRFGYDYRMTAAKADMFAILRYSPARFRLRYGIEVGQSTLRREGFYEKELFPGNGSFGKSAEYRFNPYTVNASAGYSFSARHFVDISAVAAETAPYVGNVFLNPDYSNTAIDNPRTVKMLSACFDYAMRMRRFSLEISAFATRTTGESAVYRYWDDIEAAYSDMVVRGIDKLWYGAEAAGQYEISPRFTLRFAASVGSYTYHSNPEIFILDDATRFLIVNRSKSYMKGYRLASTPERAATAEIRYGSRGWLASLTANYMGRRYVDISPLRRMERAYTLADSPEMRGEFLRQERLGDAVTMNLFMLKTFYLEKGTVTAMFSVNNLLGNTDIVYNGYEQMRIVKKGTAPNLNWKPFPNKYLYSYGRMFYASLTYSF